MERCVHTERVKAMGFGGHSLGDLNGAVCPHREVGHGSWSDMSLRDFMQSVQSVALCPLSLHKEPMIYPSVLQTHRCSGEVKQRFQAYELNQKIIDPIPKQV